MIPTGSASRTLYGIAIVLAMLLPVAAPAAPKSRTETPPGFTFTVIGNVPERAEDVAPARALLDAIDAERPAFVVHLGNLKGRDESCSDELLEARHDLLDSLITPVVYIPGDHDWSDCQRPAAGSFDPIERLLRLRELFYPDDNTLGQRAMTVMRQSDQAKFRSYRENTRWTMNDVLFVTLNVPGDNNNYKIAGGRNGEYEDRLEANRQWLARAFSVARQRKLAGMVIMMQADPLFEDGWERRRAPNIFDGLLRRRSHDGYLALKRQLRALSRDYDGAVLLIHGASQTFVLDRPLKDEDGRPDPHVMRARTYGSPVLDRWLEVSVTPGRTPLFHIRSRRIDSSPAQEATPAPTQ
ncbi:metallophosphoesterase [Ralstonia soli]|uniref:Metallophosphoesterase n=1 Tax=Ralstonia soli TaxID=2953896 RepID=A0ABT1AI63_9RALS|nr:metallophosphoesterase [Ralstonia soli]MCO5398098.1 metallophosphoesterase [Ralstonia soli]